MNMWKELFAPDGKLDEKVVSILCYASDEGIFSPDQYEFYELFDKVAKNGYDLLEKGHYAALIIGDKYANSQIQPLGFECMRRMNNLGFITKSIMYRFNIR